MIAGMKNLLPAIFLFLATPSVAGPPVVDDVRAVKSGGSWTFHVTISHADEGWDHYADGWGVYTKEGRELGYRVLHHPHVTEQPFTRSLSNVIVPGGVSSVVIVPRDSVHGTGAGFEVSLTPDG